MTSHLPHLPEPLPFCLTLSVSGGEGRSRWSSVILLVFLQSVYRQNDEKYDLHAGMRSKFRRSIHFRGKIINNFGLYRAKNIVQDSSVSPHMDQNHMTGGVSTIWRCEHPKFLMQIVNVKTDWTICLIYFHWIEWMWQNKNAFHFTV